MYNEEPKDNFNIDELLSSLLSEPAIKHNSKDSLNELFEKRLALLHITRTDALSIMGIERVTLLGILNGKQKRVDFTNLVKLSNFLMVDLEKVVILYLDELQKSFPDNIKSDINKIEFLKTNFDLAVLKKIGFINNLNDYSAIEEKIKKHFKLKDIFDYKKPNLKPAFSSSAIVPKNLLNREFWINTSEDQFISINNPYNYDRKKLIEFFPHIRWHSMDVEMGLISIIKDLYKLGITVIYMDSMPGLHARGLTIAYNNKPCIVISNYVGFYPTLWFAIIHELFHVLFDWDSIVNNSYHLSEDENDNLMIQAKEKEADNFALEYLFSQEKMNVVAPKIYEHEFVKTFAESNNVHYSFIYIFYATQKKNNKNLWSLAHKYNPKIEMETMLKNLRYEWNSEQTIHDFFKKIKKEYYN